MQITREKAIRLWLPPLAWAAMILYLSGDNGSSGHSGSLLQLILGNRVSPQALEIINLTIRKCAHVIGYATLSLLNHRALENSRGLTRAFRAVILATAVAITDEYHQSWTSTRTGQPSDVLLDAVAAAGAQVVLYLRLRYP
jgi:VanZ family protein